MHPSSQPVFNHPCSSQGLSREKKIPPPPLRCQSLAQHPNAASQLSLVHVLTEQVSAFGNCFGHIYYNITAKMKKTKPSTQGYLSLYNYYSPTCGQSLFIYSSEVF